MLRSCGLQVQQEMEELHRNLVRSSEDKKKKTCKQVQSNWEETLQKLLNTQELADNLIGEGGFEQLSLFSVRPVVLQTLEQLGSRQENVCQLLSQLQQQLENCNRFQERLEKVQHFCCTVLVLDRLDLVKPLKCIFRAGMTCRA